MPSTWNKLSTYYMSYTFKGASFEEEKELIDIKEEIYIDLSSTTKAT